MEIAKRGREEVESDRRERERRKKERERKMVRLYVCVCVCVCAIVQRTANMRSLHSPTSSANFVMFFCVCECVLLFVRVCIVSVILSTYKYNFKSIREF